MIRTSVSCQGIREDIFENFHFRGHLPTKSEIESLSNRHLTQSSLQVTGCTAERYCLLHVVVQGPGSFRYLVNFSIRHTVAELRGIKLPNFRILTYFFYTKPVKRTFRLHRRMITILHVVGEGPKKCIPAASFPVTSVRGAGDPQPCPNFRLWQMAIPIQNTNTRRVRSGPKMFWGRMYFPNKYLCPYPQNHPKTPFWGPFNAKPIIQRALRKSHVNGSTKLKL